MELRSTREMRRNEQLTKTRMRQAGTPEAPAGAQAKPAQKQAPADKLTLSRQALSYLEEQNQKRWQWQQEREQRRQDRMNDSLSSLDSAKKEIDLLEKAMKVLKKCQQIAASIMKGNRVPPEDLRYLMENDPEGYKLAMAMRRENPDPEDEESVLDEEDRNGGRVEGTDSGGEAPAPSAPAPAASSGGGESAATAE